MGGNKRLMAVQSGWVTVRPKETFYCRVVLFSHPGTLHEGLLPFAVDGSLNKVAQREIDVSGFLPMKHWHAGGKGLHL